jgi:hypothetical protein
MCAAHKFDNAIRPARLLINPFHEKVSSERGQFLQIELIGQCAC